MEGINRERNVTKQYGEIVDLDTEERWVWETSKENDLYCYDYNITIADGYFANTGSNFKIYSRDTINCNDFDETHFSITIDGTLCDFEKTEDGMLSLDVTGTRHLRCFLIAMIDVLEQANDRLTIRLEKDKGVRHETL